MKNIVILLALILSFSKAQSQELVIGTEDILSSKTFRENGDEILETALQMVEADDSLGPKQKSLFGNELRSLPFRRIVDIELAILSGLPDLVGICLEGHPVGGVAIEACASTMVFLSSLSLMAKYRWALVANNKNLLGLGPGVGYRSFKTLCFDTCNSGDGLDIAGSLEYVRWIRAHFGLTVQLDLGGSYYWFEKNQHNNGVRPMGRLTFGVAF